MSHMLGCLFSLAGGNPNHSDPTWTPGIVLSNPLFSVTSSYVYSDFEVKVAQSCLILCDSTDCSPTGSSVRGILQARILQWVAIPFFRGSSQPRDRTQGSCITGKFFTIWATKEALAFNIKLLKFSIKSKIIHYFYPPINKSRTLSCFNSHVKV